MPTNQMPNDQHPTGQKPNDQKPNDQAAAQGPAGQSDECAPKRVLPAATVRALAEAQARRARRERDQHAAPAESNGRGGPDPTRYGDWEVNGLASDF